MTFGLGIRVHEGLLAIADTRITSGTEVTQARKIRVYKHDDRAFFILASGLRSVRDKALTYFDAFLESAEAPLGHAFEAVNAFATQVRRVAEEDKTALEESGLSYDIHCLIGGQLRHDRTPHLYLLYPQGNWVEIGEGTPYQIVGVGSYGKPVLDRALRYEDPLRHALKVGLLAFDATHISASNVDLPLDVVVFTPDPYRIIMHRFEADDLASLSRWWQARIREGVLQLPNEWEDVVFNKLAAAPPIGGP